MTSTNLPVSQLRNTLDFGEASIATQWYCPPDVGVLYIVSRASSVTEGIPVTHIETSSARDAAVVKSLESRK